MVDGDIILQKVRLATFFRNKGRVLRMTNENGVYTNTRRKESELRNGNVWMIICRLASSPWERSKDFKRGIGEKSKDIRKEVSNGWNQRHESPDGEVESYG